MPTFIDIAANPAKPIYIDAESVTNISVWPDKGEMTISDANGQALGIGYAGWGVDPALAVQKLADAGFPLVSVPVRYDGKEHPCFIAPSAVAYITVSQPRKDGTVGVIAGVRGRGRQESNSVKPEELQALLDAVKASGKTLLEFDPAEARSRWSMPAKLYIDPSSVTTIEDTGLGVDVMFDKVGRLDIRTRDLGKDNEELNKIANRLLRAHPDPNSITDITPIFKEAHRLQELRRSARVTQ
ncbi:MAG: hypothetical protein ACLQVY_21845 [Limisphaerales bacterium]